MEFIIKKIISDIHTWDFFSVNWYKLLTNKDIMSIKPDSLFLSIKDNDINPSFIITSTNVY